MTRQAIPLHIEDLPAFARRLAREMPDTASHQSWLNSLARAAGFRNWQHLRAAFGDRDPAPAPNMDRLRKAQRHFDAQGFYTHLPSKVALQLLCLWPIWARLPAGEVLDERALSARIDALTRFRDAAHVRRGMIEAGLMRRNLDGSRYERVEQAPPPEARLLIAALADPRSAA